jgi:arsenite methyltransferase
LLKGFFARQLARPSGWFGSLFMSRWLERANAGMNALAVEELALTAEDKLLEVGFGSGFLLAKVLEEGSCAFVAGVDLSVEMVSLARRRFRIHIEAGRAHIQHGNIEHLPFADGHFTKLCSVNTLYFWRNPSASLVECRRVLRPGGTLVLCFNAKVDLAAYLGDTQGFTLYELSEVQALLTGAGFKEIVVAERRDSEQGLFYCVASIAA